MAIGINTPIDLIHLALKTAGVIGVGQTPDWEDTNDCLNVLNAMLGQWTRERWLIPNLIDIAHTATGAQSYTVGPGGDYNVPRPDRLEAAYSRLLPVPSNAGPFDFPLTLIDSHEDYASINLKRLVSFPTSIFYDSAYPLGSVFPYPVPQANMYEIHLIIKNTITEFSSLTTPLGLPPEYIDALIWNLSTRIRPLYQLQPEPTIVALAKASLSVIRQANAQVPLLRMPASVLNVAGGTDPTLGNLNGLPWAV